MDLFILLHTDAYEASDGKIIACSLFRENLTDRMNHLANEANNKVFDTAHLPETNSSHFFVYDEKEDSWIKWNGRRWTEKLSIRKFNMI
ncbi:hypothetical protein [Arcticibacter sp. MXS-1]|uniref:hypothetical protein n=1 Tax=Arcticibacter sp. MXS-1 TaxID=3341726 RepID=UPI0035A8A128